MPSAPRFLEALLPLEIDGSFMSIDSTGWLKQLDRCWNILHFTRYQEAGEHAVETTPYCVRFYVLPLLMTSLSTLSCQGT